MRRLWRGLGQGFVPQDPKGGEPVVGGVHVMDPDICTGVHRAPNGMRHQLCDRLHGFRAAPDMQRHLLDARGVTQIEFDGPVGTCEQPPTGSGPVDGGKIR